MRIKVIFSNMKKKDICIDFDGVLNNYKGWAGEENIAEIKTGCPEFLMQLSEIYNIHIFTVRNVSFVEEWLNKYKISKYIKSVTNKKIPAVLYIDDRALTFKGNYENLMEEIRNFKPYWQ